MRRTKLIIFRITFIINCFSTEQVLYGRIYHRHELRAISWPVHCENETDNELLGHNHIDIEKRALPHEIFAQFLNSDYSGSPLQPTRLCNDSERRASPKASHHAFSLSLCLWFLIEAGNEIQHVQGVKWGGASTFLEPDFCFDVKQNVMLTQLGLRVSDSEPL